ncbi:MAG: hypothetical protein ACRD3E_01445 [Terriglobales bacterium]
MDVFALSVERKKKLYELLSTFLLDTSVLIFVFVPLDALMQFGRSAVRPTVFAGTLASAAFFFVIAFIMSVAGDEL